MNGAVMQERFSDDAWAIVLDVSSEAHALAHPRETSLHLLLSLVKGDGDHALVLQCARVMYPRLFEYALVTNKGKLQPPHRFKPREAELNEALVFASRAADESGSAFIQPLHLVLGTLFSGTNAASTAVAAIGADRDAVIAHARQRLARA